MRTKGNGESAACLGKRRKLANQLNLPSDHQFRRRGSNLHAWRWGDQRPHKVSTDGRKSGTSGEEMMPIVVPVLNEKCNRQVPERISAACWPENNPAYWVDGITLGVVNC